MAILKRTIKGARKIYFVDVANTIYWLHANGQKLKFSCLWHPCELCPCQDTLQYSYAYLCIVKTESFQDKKLREMSTQKISRFNQILNDFKVGRTNIFAPKAAIPPVIPPIAALLAAIANKPPVLTVAAAMEPAATPAPAKPAAPRTSGAATTAAVPAATPTAA